MHHELAALIVVVGVPGFVAVMAIAVMRAGCDDCGTCSKCTGLSINEQIRLRQENERH